MFLAKSVAESEKRQERQKLTLFDVSGCNSQDEKIALLYADFTTWGTRLERDVSTIKKTAIWIAVLLAFIALKAYG